MRRDRLHAASLFLVAVVVRLAGPRITDDNLIYPARGRQILMGEVPVRDFADVGYFLTYYLSAFAQLLFGPNLLGEVLLSGALIAAGAAVTLWLAARASGSLLVAWGVTAPIVLLYPRFYHYPKSILYPVAVLLFWKYLDERRADTLALVGLTTGVAFLVRHDHGVYIAVGSAVMLVAAHWRDGLWRLGARGVVYGLAAGALIGPFLLFVAVTEGLVSYVSLADAWRRQIAARERLGWPPFHVSLSPLVRVDRVSPTAAPRVTVWWGATVSVEQRQEKEREYRLGRPEFEGGRRWEYALEDASRVNLCGLVRDRAIETAHGIDRESCTVREPWVVSVRRRLPGVTLAVAPGLLRRENAIAWLYYTVVGLPVLAALVLLGDRLRGRSDAWPLPGEAGKILCLAALTVVANQGLLRHKLPYRFPDVAALAAVLAAWLVGRWLNGAPRASRTRPPSRASVRAWGRVGVAVALVGATGASAVAVGATHAPVKGMAGILLDPRALWVRLSGMVAEHRLTPPIDSWAPPGSVGLRGLTRYVHRCTRPGDRLLVVTHFAPSVFFFSERALVGGTVGVFPDMWLSQSHQDRMVAAFSAHRVPVVIVDTRYSREFELHLPQLRDYLERAYRPVQESAFGGDSSEVFRVLVDPRLTPSGIDEGLSLPCFSG